jgi:hypothetical protein
MKRLAVLSFIVWLSLAGRGLSGEAGSVAELPANKWTKLAGKPLAGYMWSFPVYAPGRGQLLHWGSADIRTGGRMGWDKGTSRNDVLAFDAAALDWSSDYPGDDKAPVGIAGVTGAGGMLPSGVPKPSHVMLGGSWDSKREQVIYTMKGLMAAYDPKTKKWKDLGAKTVMPFPAYEYGSGSAVNPRTEFAGGPPVYGAATCYDPVNDEILLFPHFDAKNIALRDATGQITGHYGTFRYGFKDNTWRLVADTFGSEETRKARRDLIAAMAKASSAMDAAWLLGRKPDAAKAAEAGKQLEAIKDCGAPVAEQLKAAAAALAANKPADAVKPLREALWAMNDALDTKLRVEPPPRCGAPMVYDEKNKLIVMFGGYTNLARTDLPAKTPDVQDFNTGLNDTWVYDCASRQWRELPCPKRPPTGQFATRMPMMAYDPESGLVLLLTLSGASNAKKVFDTDTGLTKLEESAGAGRKATLWTLDAAKGEWSKRDELDWPGGLTSMASGGGSSYPTTPMATSLFGFDVKNRLLVVLQREKDVQATYVLRLDLSKLAAAPAPDRVAPPPVKMHEVPGDDPAWVAKLKDLPANTWVRAKPPREPAGRGWGNLSIDPVRGWAVYFGGGHATYQINDVAVYAVGANAWTTGAGEFNSYVTPQGWEGSTLGYRGGPACGHQRNAYQSFDGRMYVLTGSDERTATGSVGSTWNYVFHADKNYVRFYDIDRGGVWRDTRISSIERPEDVPNHPNVHMVDPAGRIVNLIRQPGGGMAGRIYRYVYSGPLDKFFTSIYDVNEDKLLVREVPKPFPPAEGESRPYCYLAGQGKVFYMNAKPDDGAAAADPKKPPMKQVTWLYDTRENKFAELAPAHTPPAGGVQVVEYVESQKCALAVIGGRQWVYSFEKNDWAELPLTAEGGKMGVEGPYGQLVWVAKYGVFVNLAGGTWVMRPDFSQVKFGAAGGG